MAEEEKKAEEPKEDPREGKKRQGTDYTKAAREKAEKGQEKPEVKAVVSADSVVVQKRGLGSKIKDLFIAADFRSVGSFVIMDVLIPAARNMIVDTAEQGIRRMMYGETTRRAPGTGITSRFSYQTPVQRDWRDPRTRPPQGQRIPRANRNDFLLQTKEDADLVVDEMYNILNVYEMVTLYQLKELLGLPGSHTDNKWGWFDLRGTSIRQVRDGWLIDLPPEEAID